MSTHYICTGGCKGVEQKPGVCQAPVCLKHGLPLLECNCTDGIHAQVIPVCEHCGKLCNNDGTCEIETYKPELVA